MRLPAAILLDLDDTLIDFTGGTESCWESACSGFAADIGDTHADRLLAAIHEYRGWYWSDPERHRRGRLDLAVARREIVTGAMALIRLDLPAAADGIAAAYIAARDAGLCLFSDTVQTLDKLRAAGVRLAMVTNGRGEDQRRKIERFGLAPWFDYILIEGEFGTGKPDERVYRHVLAELGSSASEAWMVGDNLEWDVAAPQRLGLHGIWYDGAGSGLPAGSAVRPDRIIRNLAELVRD